MIINNFTKMLIGAAIGTVVVAGVAIAVDSHQQKKAEQKVSEAKSEIDRARAVMARNEREQKSVIQRIKKYVQKKVVKFLAFIALHMDQIEAISTCVGLVTGVIGIASAIKEYKRGDDLQKQIDDLNKELVYQTDKLGLYVEDCTKVLNNNLKTTDEDIIKFAKAMNVQLLEHDEVVA